jgi:hypothetical protein
MTLAVRTKTIRCYGEIQRRRANDLTIEGLMRGERARNALNVVVAFKL